MIRKLAVLAIAAPLALGGCGSDTWDRAGSGAGIGAGAGLVLGAVTGLSILEGVVIGAAAGGLIGGLTTQEMINLGNPVWASADQSANRSAVARVQAGLTELGYDPGPVDGVQGPRTEAAIRQYQRDHDLDVNGLPTATVAQHIESRIEQARA